MKFNVVVLLACMFVPGQAAKDDPIAKVVVLIKELMSKIEGDSKMEQKTYDKFACWCEKTLARKAAAIDEAKEIIKKTQEEIIELKGKLGELGASIKQLEKEIKENKEARKEATEIRDKENADYVAKRTESEQCIGALEAAIKVLAGAGTKKALLSSLQEAQMISVAAGLKDVVPRIPDSEAFQESDLQIVNDFVANPSKYLHSGFSGAQTDAQSTNPFGDYAPASDQVVGIMKGMYDSFSADLEKANAEEGEKQKAFEELMATKMAEFETLSATLEAKTGEHAAAEKTLAEDRTLLADTTAQLEKDEEFFAATKDSCKAKAAEWAERTRLITEELQGMAKAVEILEGGAKTFESAHTTFIQLSNSNQAQSDSMLQARNGAYAILKPLVKRHGGMRLAFLAATIRSGGHFDEVIAMIDKMIADLRVEEQEDIKTRDMCNNQENALKAEKEDLEYNIDKKTKKKDSLSAKKDDTEQAIVAKQDEIKAAEAEMAEMLASRNEEHEKFKKALKDDVDAVALIGKAIESLTAFYENNKIPLELTQEDPKYTVDEDTAPTAEFGGPRKSESTGIISILGMLKEDLEKEIKVARAEDKEAQEEYTKLNAEAQAGVDAMKKTETELNAEKADLESKIADTESEIESHKDMKDENKAAKEALAPSCDWVKETFDSRRAKRKAEMQGLEEAKALLAGARPEFIQGTFLHRQ